MLVVPVCAETIGNVLNDSPVRPAAFQRFKYLVEPLDPPFGARERAFFFKTWSGGQHHLPQHACCAEEEMPLNEKIQPYVTLPPQHFVVIPYASHTPPHPPHIDTLFS